MSADVTAALEIHIDYPARPPLAQAIGFSPPIEHFSASLRVRRLLELAGDPINVLQEQNRDLWDALGLQELRAASTIPGS